MVGTFLAREALIPFTLGRSFLCGILLPVVTMKTSDAY